MSLKKELVSGTVYMAIAKYSGMVMTILISAILSRLLTPENYGVVALATVMLALFNLFADIGIGPAVIQNKTLTAEDMDSINTFNSYQGLVLNIDKKTVSIDGENVPFTKTEFELLRLLLEEKGRVFSRQELIDRVWPKDVLVLDRTVDVNITRMRKKIGKFAKCIVTRLGFGYYFDA